MSRTTYAIYIPKSGLANLQIGLASGVWGWRQSAFDTTDSASVIRSMEVDDLVLMVQGGPNPRVARYGWTGARMAGIYVCKVVRRIHRSTSPVGLTTCIRSGSGSCSLIPSRRVWTLALRRSRRCACLRTSGGYPSW